MTTTFKKKLTEASWAERLTDYQARLSTARQEMAGLNRERAELAPKSVDGDAAASKRISEIIEKRNELTRVSSELEMAVQSAREGVERDEAGKAEQEATAKAERVKALAVDLSGTSTEVDLAFIALMQALEKRRAGVQVLERELGANRLHPRFHSPAVIGRAARFFGIHNFMELGHTSAAHHQPMAEQDAAMLKGLIEAPLKEAAA